MGNHFLDTSPAIKPSPVHSTSLYHSTVPNLPLIYRFEPFESIWVASECASYPPPWFTYQNTMIMTQSGKAQRQSTPKDSSSFNYNYQTFTTRGLFLHNVILHESVVSLFSHCT